MCLRVITMTYVALESHFLNNDEINILILSFRSSMESGRSTYYEQISQDMKIRYDEKIEKCNGIDPYTINERDLSIDKKDFPEITIWDIQNHLVYSMSPFTKKMCKAIKSMEGYKFFESGFVLSVGSKKIENLVIVRGKVRFDT